MGLSGPVEACFLLDDGDAVLWIERSASASALPDSRSRWQAIWSHRDVLTEIAHSHPTGLAAFSSEDDTTMAAIDAALGRPLRYSVATPHLLIRISRDSEAWIEHDEPWWVDWLRILSGMRVPP